MGFLESIAVEVVAAILAAGVLGGLGWLGARLFRRRRETPGAGRSICAQGEPRPLRPLLTLLREEAGDWTPSTDWDAAGGAHRVLPLRRAWKAEAVERALRGSGAPLAVRFLHRPTEAGLRRALGARALSEDQGYDVLVVDAHGDRDGALYFEGPHGESHPLSPDDLGRPVAGSGVRLALLSACHSAAACRALRKAGVPTVVGMAAGVPEDAASVYLEEFLRLLARGERPAPRPPVTPSPCHPVTPSPCLPIPFHLTKPPLPVYIE